jgi:hypothetical protein
MERQRNPGGPQLFYRLGLTREQNLFREHPASYSGICIRANYLAYFQKFTLGLLLELAKPFFIDPVTYIFAREPAQILNDDGNVKSSYEKLGQHYGEPVVAALGRVRITQAEFNDPAVRQGFAERVISYQRVQALQLPEKYQRYQRFLGASQMQPSFLLPPYFYLESLDDGWAEINTDLAARAAAFAEQPVYPVVFLSRTLLSTEGSIERIADLYDHEAYGGFFVWVEDVHGVWSDISTLRAYRRLVQGLAALGKPVFALYGDYFSILLWYDGLIGFCSGICYSERKEVDPPAIEGSIPDRYYVRRLKYKAQLDTTIQRLDIGQYEDLACKCGICPQDMDLSSIDTEDSQRHFIHVRSAELDQAASEPREAILSELSGAFDRYQANQLLKADHLLKWIRIFS